ncbi:tol-pal system protein YbgF [Afipia clevelandensis ATCC 49720]|uniref:Cell division coordinator CpoB n=2 Tax=Afipia clevelandensis TaxID=1034 RepID=K8P1K4_9BRAD|nr:tol-pal system protein YbgF [Afipia clevelandensis ATCC 49720]
MFACAVLVSAPLWLPTGASAQQDMDPELRIERLENQLRTLTGQNEELQYRNRQLEEQLRALQGGQPQAGQPQAGQAAAPRPANPNVAAPQVQPNPNAGYQQNSGYQQNPGYQQPPAVGEAPPVITAPVASSGRRGDAFDPSRNPNAPGVPRALGGGQMPVTEGPVGAPGGRDAGEPLNLSNVGGARDPYGTNAPAQRPVQQAPNTTASLTTLPPSASPRDEFDLGIGYIQRKDYALAEETMRNFAQKYPTDALLPDSQYWLGESLYQRQKYRDAAEVFLGVTTKYETAGKAPDSLLRLGQSLAALKEKEAACAAFGEVTRKYPRASNGVKQGVAREQKRAGC